MERCQREVISGQAYLEIQYRMHSGVISSQRLRYFHSHMDYLQVQGEQLQVTRSQIH